MDKEDKKDSKYTFGKFIWLMCIVFSVWLISGASIYFYIDGWRDRGTFGDMFGAINALFSGLAFAGIIFTILLQREELKLQRKELELTRGELTRTASAQEASQEELSRQADTLQKTAQINAITTLIGMYQEQMNVASLGDGKQQQLKLNIERSEVRLESLLESLENKNPA